MYSVWHIISVGLFRERSIALFEEFCELIMGKAILASPDMGGAPHYCKATGRISFYAVKKIFHNVNNLPFSIFSSLHIDFS